MEGDLQTYFVANWQCTRSGCFVNQWGGSRSNYAMPEITERMAPSITTSTPINGVGMNLIGRRALSVPLARQMRPFFIDPRYAYSSCIANFIPLRGLVAGCRWLQPLQNGIAAKSACHRWR